ncbi:MAG: polysaccharide biosynthesis/export family protein [Pseudomonadota bacterium]
MLRTFQTVSRGGVALAVAATLALGACGLPRSGPYIEDITGDNGANTPEDQGFDLITVAPEVVAIANKDESLGFEMNLIEARSERTEILGVGDVLQVTIWERGENGLFSPIGGATALTAEVEEGGTIYLPYIGNVRASGRTADGLRKAIVALLEDRTLDPQVEVKRETGDSKSITITGTAGVAAVVPIDRTSKSLLSLLAKTGFSVTDPEVVRVKVRRGNLEGQIWMRDLFDNPQFDIPVRAGDIIFLNQDTRHFRALGAVGQARVPFPTRDISALDAIALIGGLNPALSDPSGIFVFRQEPPEIAVQLSENATVDQRRNVAYLIDMTRGSGLFLADQFRMQDGDVLYVTDAPFARFQKIAAAVGSVVGFAGTAASLSTAGGLTGGGGN